MAAATNKPSRNKSVALEITPADERFLMSRNIDNIFLPTDTIDKQYGQEVPLTKRTTFNTTGKEIPLSVNTFDITNFPTKKIYQYDVCIPFYYLNARFRFYLPVIGPNWSRCREAHRSQESLGFENSQAEAWGGLHL